MSEAPLLLPEQAPSCSGLQAERPLRSRVWPLSRRGRHSAVLSLLLLPTPRPRTRPTAGLLAAAVLSDPRHPSATCLLPDTGHLQHLEHDVS